MSVLPEDDILSTSLKFSDIPSVESVKDHHQCMHDIPEPLSRVTSSSLLFCLTK